MTDFLDQKRKEITSRLAELAPLVDEYQRLQAAATALDGALGSKPAVASTSAPARRRPGRPRGSTKAKATVGATARRRPGRRKGSGTRAAQALTLVQNTPGITIPQLAAEMKIKQNYLYRVLPALEQEGKVKKQGRGWVPGK